MVPILYFWLVDDNPVQEAKLAGIRRYADSRRWEVVAVHESESGPGSVEALVAKYRPVGCIVESAGGKHFLPPSRFGRVPVVYLDMPPGFHAGLGLRSVSADDEAVAEAAFRELSAGRPESLAVVEYFEPVAWSRRRASAFLALAAEEKIRCPRFPARRGEDAGSRATRLRDWLSALRRPCGISAVNDEVGAEVAAACRDVLLFIPRDVTLVGVDDSAKFSGEADPPFTSIRLDFERMGYAAAKMLGDVIGRADCCRQTRRHGETEFGRNLRASPPPSSVLGGSKTSAIVGPLLAVRRKSTSGRGRHEPFIMEAIEIIRREACDGLTARDLAERFTGSRTLFNLRFREATGHSVLDEILHVRMEKALTLLAETDTAIGAIYSYCGFRTNRALDFLFHSRFKMSMREWRRRNSRK